MPIKRIYYNEFNKDILKGNLRSTYLLTGAEEFLKNQAVNLIVAKGLNPAEKDLNLEYLYAGTDISGQEVKERALTLPFLAKYRILVVRQVDKWKTKDLETIKEYLENPASSTILVLSSQTERITQSIWKKIATQTYHVECYPLFDNQIPTWVEQRVRQLGKNILREATLFLIELIGNKLSDLDNEIKKLITYIGDENNITLKTIQEVTGYFCQNTIYELTTAIGKRETVTAIKLAKRIMAEGIHPLQILGAITWHFRELFLASHKLDQGEELASIVGHIRHPQARKDIQIQIKKYKTPEFINIFKQLLKLDEKIKYGKQHLELILQLTIIDICKLNIYNSQLLKKKY